MMLSSTTALIAAREPRSATLKPAISPGPAAAAEIALAIAVMTPTSSGCDRRHQSSTRQATPTTMSTTMSTSECASHVSASTSAPMPSASTYIVTSTNQSRAERRPSGASRSSPGSSW